jgi:hypothetical protein
VQIDTPVIIPGECTPADRQLAEDASILAFRALIENCIDRDADLLLLTGDTFGSSLVTLREQMELEQGLKKLSDHDVAVVIVPGTEDPARAWREHIRLPEGVALVDAKQTEPIRIYRDGHEVCAVFPVAVVDDAGRPQGCRLPQTRPGVFRIGLVGAGSIDQECLHEIISDSHGGNLHIQLDSRGANGAEQALIDAISHGVADYLAIGIEGPRQTHTTGSVTLHNPGPLQALDASINGSCGAALISVGHDAPADIEHLPCAKIRWEQLSINAQEVRSIEDLAVEMEQALNGLSAAEHEELWIIHWRLSLSAGLSTELSQSALSTLWELIDSSSHSRPTCRHILQAAAHKADEANEHEQEIGTLEEHLRSDLEHLIRQSSNAEWNGPTWGRRIIRETARLSPARLLPKVRHHVAGALHRAGME